MGLRPSPGWKRRRAAFVLAGLVLALLSPASASPAAARVLDRDCAPGTAAHVDHRVTEDHSPALDPNSGAAAEAPEFAPSRVTRAGTITVPVYVHVVTNTTGTLGNVPNRRIAVQMAVMNRASPAGRGTAAPTRPSASSLPASTGRPTTPGSPPPPAHWRSAR